MCGFAGMVNAKPTNPALIEQVLASRGPDGRGLYEDETSWLLHRRLSIIDLDERSDQPFILPDGSVLLYNGELYNFADFERDVPTRSTSGDTEIVAHLGDDPERVSRFRGMFSYGLHRPDGTVTLVRDRFGIKPMYFAVDGDVLMYASQLRCFTSDPRPANISRQAIASFLRFGCVVTPTMFEGVFELLPGHMLTWQAGKILQIEEIPASPAVTDDLGDALRSSIHRHLVSDVPACVLLSGGLDSAVIAKLSAESSLPTPAAVTLSVGGVLDELDRARRTADNYGLELHVVSWSDEEVREVLDEYLSSMDQPSIDGLNSFLVCRAVHSLGFKVALSGLGADELFGGYAVYRQAGGAKLLSPLANGLYRKALQFAGGGLNGAKFDEAVTNRRDQAELGRISRQLRTVDEVKQLAGVAPPTPAAIRDFGDSIMEGEFTHYMQAMLLRDSDAFSMASSVELRVPFLDDDLLALALQRTSYQRAFQGKQCLVDALDDPYLAQVFDEPKTGFRLPMAEWFDIESPNPAEPWAIPWSAQVLDDWQARVGQRLS